MAASPVAASEKMALGKLQIISNYKSLLSTPYHPPSNLYFTTLHLYVNLKSPKRISQLKNAKINPWNAAWL